MSVNSNFCIDLCSKEDLGKVINFSRRLEEKNINILSSKRNYFLSRYNRNNSHKLNLFLLKDKNKRIMGCGGYVPFKGLYKNKKIKGLFGTDIVIDPNYKKRFPAALASLYLSYRNFISRDNFLFLTFPNGKPIADGFRRLGWNKFTTLYDLRHFSFGYIASKFEIPLEFKVITHFDKKIDYFFKRIAAKHDFLACADSDLLNRKYIFNPYRNYLALGAFKNNRIIGYAIAKKKYSQVYVTDLVVDLDYPRNILFLLAEVFKRLGTDNYSFVSCYLSHKKYINVLKGFGFRLFRQKMCFYFDYFGKKSLFFSAGGSYHLNGVEEEVF